MDYIRRIADDEIDRRLEAFNAINIVGPKGCGKTRTARERCSTVIEFQDEEKRDGYISVAETQPSLFFRNQKPILFDEWQDAPKIWGAVRKVCDDAPEETGSFFLTGSASKNAGTAHTGTGRISELTLYPMTLWETGESNGKVSLFQILTDREYQFEGCSSEITLPELFFAAGRGGWPRALTLKSDRARLELAKDYCRQIYQKDITAFDGVQRNPEWGRMLMWSYARNMATTAKKKNIYADVQATQNVSEVTLASYVEVLERLFIIRDIDAWTPQLRSKTAIRAAKKHIFTDPSIGLAVLGIQPDYFNNDLDFFGHVFENMVLRDLLVYAEMHGGRVLHYTDDSGLEADAVYQLGDGRYALIEIRVGANRIPEAEASLLKFLDLIRKKNAESAADESHPGPMYREPDALIIICATAPMAYTTGSGVKVIPVGCLRE